MLNNVSTVILLGLIAELACGFVLCQVTHKQRGIESDRPVSDLIVPPEWDSPVPEREKERVG